MRKGLSRTPHAHTRGQNPSQPAMSSSGLPSWLARPANPRADRAPTPMPPTPKPPTTPAKPATKRPSRFGGQPLQPAPPLAPGRAGNPSARTERRKIQIAQQAQAWSQLVDVEALADRLVEQSADREGAAILRPLLPPMIVAMVQGATTPGPSGAADRAALAKLIGAPWASTGADRKGGGTAKTRDAGKAVGGRLTAALARKERALRAENGTDDAADGDEGP